MRNTFNSSSSTGSSNRRQRRQRRGLGLCWSTVVLVALCMFASLAVDFGRVQLVKGQLRAAADASALAAANLVLSDVPAAKQAAVDTARGNLAHGAPVALTGADVVPVIWDAKQHTWALPASGQKPN